MESDNELFLPASQMIEKENGQESETVPSQETGQAAAGGQENSQTGKTTRQKKTKEPPGTTKDPCIYCGKNCTKGTVQCTICALWCHMSCTGLSKEALKGLEIQAKEVGQAYWACRACMNFNNKWNKQMREVNKRQEETEAQVANNTDKIEEVRMVTEELRRELKEQAKKTEGIQERMQSVIDEELREREARRLNLVIHGLPEPEENIKEPRARMEQDKLECEKLFIAMKARTRYQSVRFCRRIGERGGDPRPLVFGVYSEEEKRHLLEKAKELLYTRYEHISIVPDMTKSQRSGEQKLRHEANQRNSQLSEEDRSKNLKWLVVGKRGEKRLIKGVEREGQWGRQERERGVEAASSGWNPQIRVNTGPNRVPNGDQNQHWRSDRRSGGLNWRPEHNSGGYIASNGGFRNRGGFTNPNNNGNISNSISSGGTTNNSNNGGYGCSGGPSNGGPYNNVSNSNNTNNRGHRNGHNSNSSGFNSGSSNNGGGNWSVGLCNFNNNENNDPQFNSNRGGGGSAHGGSGAHGGGSALGGGGAHGDGGAQGGGQFRPTEIGTRRPDGGAWAQYPENTSNGELDRQARQQGEWQEVEDRHRNIPLLLPRPPIQRDVDQQDMDQMGRIRLNSNKRPRSYDRDMEEEGQLPSRNRRY